jgi:hypothetical protein
VIFAHVVVKSLSLMPIQAEYVSGACNIVMSDTGRPLTSQMAAEICFGFAQQSHHLVQGANDD